MQTVKGVDTISYPEPIRPKDVLILRNSFFIIDMHITNLKISNFRGIKDEVNISLSDFACVVGKNDAGKSTILKALDVFLNETAISIEDKNLYTDSNIISIEVSFIPEDVEVILDDAVPTTLVEEEITASDGKINVRKEWDVSQGRPKTKWSINRKKYSIDDCLLLNERELRALCNKYGISTQKANGDEYNNKEKRTKLRRYFTDSNTDFSYVYEELPTTGATRLKKIYEALKNIFPTFEYFKADSSLSDSDTSVQKYFKDKALKMLQETVDTNDIEVEVKTNIAQSLAAITDKINSVLSTEEQVEAQVNFDWSKIVTTSFKCKTDEKNIPLSSRGDGFRRITMMSYFEMLAEEKNTGKSVIYGFEEPETFLHPETQKKLFDSLKGMAENGFQVLVTTHSPNLVSLTNTSDIIHVLKEGSDYIVRQNDDIDIITIVEDLGIKADNRLLQLFKDDAKALFLLEGPDDVKAFNHLADVYKKEGKIDATFTDKGVVLIPIGGCDSLGHWTNYDVIKKIGKPYFILLDSDKESEYDISKNLIKLRQQGYSDEDCSVTKKREIECYIPDSYYTTLTPPITDLRYGDWDDVKELCKNHREARKLGGRKVCDWHFCNLTYAQLRSTFCPTGIDGEDEFLVIYNKIVSKII